jgi:DNA-binding GntR family transcriptional regulator
MARRSPPEEAPGSLPTIAAARPARGRRPKEKRGAEHPLQHLSTPTMSASRTRKAPLTARLERENMHDEIYEKIYVAILEHRLQPGTKLAEERLADIFGVSRARIREVLARLAHEQIVELFPQRGAFVAMPSIEQAMHVFEARRLIEPAVLRRLIETLTPERVARLRQHQALEQDARRRDEKRAIVRLSGEFHTLIAELAGNTALARQMRELSTLTCLIIFLYDAPTATSCRADEHSEIIEAVAHRDVARAEALMLEHLSHIEGSLKLEPTTAEADLESIFKS